MPDIKHAMSPIRLKWTGYKNTDKCPNPVPPMRPACLPCGLTFSHRWLSSCTTSVTYGLREESGFCLEAGAQEPRQAGMFPGLFQFFKLEGQRLQFSSPCLELEPRMGWPTSAAKQETNTRPQFNLKAACGRPCIAASQTTKAP